MAVSSSRRFAVRPSGRPVAPLLAVSVVAAAAMLSACSKKEPLPEPVRAVKLLTVGEGQIEAAQEYAGDVRARIESRLGFRVAGKIIKREVELGQRVKAGQVLARLDARDYQLSADAARAQVSSATTQRDLAQANVQRFKALRAQNFISAAEMERYEANLKAAQATLDQAKAQLSSQSNQENYTQLVADVDGVVTSVEAEPGQVVAAGTPVVRIAQDGARDAVFAVPEDRHASIRIGQGVQVRPWSDESQVVSAQVREVAASADAATRTYQVKAALQGSNLPALGSTVRVLPEGMSVSNGAVGGKVIKLPTTALRQSGGGGQGTAVWLFDPASSTVKLQPVQIATADGNEAVIASGLTAGMQVVATGVHVLNAGQKVTVYRDKYAKPEQKSVSNQPAVQKDNAPVATENVASPVAAPAGAEAGK
ncbi:efflux RND transporter periplasmic adaptor subunit [Comamonas testosteroni]|uniref:Efflux RND transporter periplasmic adaptor subunit n=1 Tax=Comamonas testosteroni TaxID=285 RepID=A0A373FLE8_COMTE|nr:efflux RND transporter periplasmic adaptor subunit [Comamonas testosteroni]RGE44980.1 efflux RND transporter periplasmic adaptor subunit [Comamonas testosteroni]